jgi:Alkylmercury lyase
VGALAANATAKRAGLAAGPRAVYQTVLRAFAATGRPPAPGVLENMARPSGLTAAQALAELAAADVLGLGSDGGIRMAYPFSAAATPHLVTISGGPLVYAMCAIDALGIPPMLSADAIISSTDPQTRDAVIITFRDGHAHWEPATAVVFAGADGVGTAEQARCGYLNFFTTPASAARWAAQHPMVTGSVLDQASAQALGKQIFGPLLTGHR